MRTIVSTPIVEATSAVTRISMVMTSTPLSPHIVGIDEVLFDANGKAWGVKTGNEIAKAPIIVGDPSYFGREKCRAVGRVVRSICITDHPIKGNKIVTECIRGGVLHGIPFITFLMPR
jgi:hypothetical protein